MCWGLFGEGAGIRGLEILHRLRPRLQKDVFRPLNPTPARPSDHAAETHFPDTVWHVWVQGLGLQPVRLHSSASRNTTSSGSVLF